MKTLRCPHCGTANRAGSNYCNNCGTDLRTGESAPLPSPATEPAPASPSAQVPPLPTPTEGVPERVPDPRATGEQQALPGALAHDQPWLRQDPVAEPTPATPQPLGAAPADTELETASTPGARRLVANVQGLLDPLRLFNESDEETDQAQQSVAATVAVPVDATLLRRLRGLLTSEPLLSDLNVSVNLPRLPALRMTWLFWLLGLAVGLPLFLGLAGPLGAPRLWPGVAEAFTTINDLPATVPVLLVWGYDPATAGEMDLVAEPLVIHLLAQRRPLQVVSLWPGGPATARRLFQQARTRLFRSQGLQLAANAAPPLAVTYLPGGAAALSLLGQNLTAGLTGQLDNAPLQAPQRMTVTPGLTVIVAAQAEDVQQWLEQAAPLNKIPLVAFTSASADPILRPYLESAQLRGLVSGFDGAYSYQAMRIQSNGLGANPALIQQVVAQNWGGLALLALLVIGNLVGLLGRTGDE